jgi:hypothetical protein
VLGLIPGVGAMYNAQFFKGLIHVVIFAVLISITDHYPIFGLFIAAWVLYQSFEAFHTAKARRDGQPLPDPLGLNEVGNWLNLGGHGSQQGQSATGYNPGPASAGQPNPGPAAPGTAAGYQQAPYTGQYQPPYTGGQYQAPGAYQAGQYGPGQYGAGYQPPPYTPVGGYVDPAVPPPVPPVYWKRKEPIGAIVLIGLGLLFLLGQLDLFNGRLVEYTWPVLLIGLGVFLMIRRMGDGKGGRQ